MWSGWRAFYGLANRPVIVRPLSLWLCLVALIAVAALNSLASARDVRDITPPGVTPGPAITGPLKRVPGISPARPSVRTRQLYRVDVITTSRFSGYHGGRRWEVALPNVIGIGPKTMCALPDGGEWPCGLQIIRALRLHLRRSPLQCAFADQAAPNIETDCRVRGKDLATRILRRGWAYAALDASAHHRKLERWARQSQFGLFQPAEAAAAEWRVLDNLSTRKGVLPPPPDLPIPDILAPLRALPEPSSTLHP